MSGIPGMKSRGPDRPQLGGPRPGSGRPPKRITLKVGDTYAAIGRAETWTVVEIARGRIVFEASTGENIVLVR